MDGQEISVDDYRTLLGQVAGLADDRVLAEILRATPFDGTNTYKTIVPFDYLPRGGTGGATPRNPGTVQSSGSANGSIIVNPFRAVAGSRTTAGTSPLQNWRDIRSGVFVGPTALAQTFQLAANSSGNTRWDLVYATIQIDALGGSGARRVKAIADGSVSTQTQTTSKSCPVTVAVVTGTASATPVIPALPGDTLGVSYNIPIAAVRVPTGFGPTSTVSPADVRGQVPTSALQSPTMGTTRIMPATGNNDQAGTYDADASGPGVWGTSGGTRPPLFLDPGMVGGEQRFAQVDLTVASHPSHVDGGVIDDSIDWRGRFFFVICSYSNSVAFATAHGLSSPVSVLPVGFTQQVTASSGFLMTLHSSMYADSTVPANGSTLFTVTPTTIAYTIYVDQVDGKMKWHSSASPEALRFWFWIMASGQQPNP